MSALVEVWDAAIATPGGRALFEGLNLRLARERVALVGRNGVGKSTLLAVLAGEQGPRKGRVVTRSAPCFVPQAPPAGGASHGDREGMSVDVGGARERAAAGVAHRDATSLCGTSVMLAYAVWHDCGMMKLKAAFAPPTSPLS